MAINISMQVNEITLQATNTISQAISLATSPIGNISSANKPISPKIFVPIFAITNRKKNQ